MPLIETEEAARAFNEAGKRFSAQQQYESAIAAFMKALEINRYDLVTLKGFADAQIKMDFAGYMCNPIFAPERWQSGRMRRS